jgi:hypothetical protein
MIKVKIISIVICLLTVLLCVNTASALLIDNGDGTVTQTRNDGSIRMWLKDANYAYTSGYDSDGLLTWYEANDWITSLNSNSYLGYNDWRLPEVLPVDGVDYDYNWRYDGSTDNGYNITSPNSEMSYMFYEELGNLGIYDTSGRVQAGGGLYNTGSFTNLEAEYYWTGRSYPYNESYAWTLHFNLGSQSAIWKGHDHHVWAVRTIVPEPISYILFLSGVLVLTLRCFYKMVYEQNSLNQN